MAGTLVLAKLGIVLHLTEAMIIIATMGLIYDFGPRMIEMIIDRLHRGTAGTIGFIMFTLGFSLQAYVNLSLLY